MSGKLLQKYALPKQAPEVLAAVEADSLDNCGAFGFLRGVHDRALMLELRQKDGTITAYPYAWLNKCRFDPSDGITLQFGSETVTITGRNLNVDVRPNVRLFASIVRHRVPWINEADGPAAMTAVRDAVIVDRIDIKG